MIRLLIVLDSAPFRRKNDTGCHTMKPAISIIVPVHNNEKTIEGCLDSILSQSLSDIELIVVDDGSTDESLKIVEAAAQSDHRIRTLSHPVSLSASQARKDGVSAVSYTHLGERFAQSRRTIGRSVVDQHGFDAPERLRGARIPASPEIGGGVVHRNDNADNG